MATGTVKWFNAGKGYGFIGGDDGEDVFFLAAALQAAGLHTLDVGERVAFALVRAERGLEAVDIRLI